MAIPLVGAGLSLLGIGGFSWTTSNVIGTSEWLTNYFDPKITSTPYSAASQSFASYATGRYQFTFKVLAPLDKDLQAIDDFFESYGYRIDSFQKPVLNVRNTFTYVKTRDAVVSSSNILASQQMATMLNSGYKFWIGDIGK